ncbi:MAG: AAA family ATPase [Prolixibacteraceae bacterium]|nr:AAA family ATPase [Prolixibacteraceae bacterium]
MNDSNNFIPTQGLDLLQRLKAEALAMANPPTETNFEAGFFRCRTANQCLSDAKSQPVPTDLFYSLWFENELTILFADTGIGKSVYAVQIADTISHNRKVLYIDLELSDKQFQKRYSDNYLNEYTFNENFYRISFKSRYSIPEGTSYEDYFISSLVNLLDRTGAQVIIIDNMTRLISSDTDKAQTAKPVMDRLNDLKFDYGLSILCLEHTRKTSSSQPISLNDLQGSKMKSNFADSAFTIGRSARDPNIRYVKQLKARSCENIYDSENIIVYEILKETNFLHFRFIEYGNEQEHLKHINDEEKTAKIEQVMQLHSQNISNRAIALQLGISEGVVRKWLKKHIR